MENRVMSQKNKGAALLWAIIFIGALSIVIANLAVMTYNESRLTSNSDLSYKAYAAAQSGIDYGLFKIREEIAESGIQNFDSSVAPLVYTFWNGTPIIDEDEQETKVEVTWTKELDLSNPCPDCKPKITVDSVATVTAGEKTAKRRLQVIHDYKRTIQAVTFENGNADINTLNTELKDRLNAIVTVDIYNPPSVNPPAIPLEDRGDKPEFKLTFNKKGGIPIEMVINADKYNGAVLQSDKNYRWRFNYVGGAGVLATLEEASDIDIDLNPGTVCDVNLNPGTKCERRWKCGAEESFFEEDKNTDFWTKNQNELASISINPNGTVAGDQNNHYLLVINGQIDNIVGIGRESIQN
ncbi:MAG: hypothetical protein UU65_C0002G0091 [candidate division CPR2 bacterium GW2011_GWC1_41_48]|uniref:Type 4 fimbrial biogenesis protein PilX N-terminal domain-containing protein n=1 Tax=candidate division CPR2 bacterium GW2011_GWC1_41_48 TaxID=1618344 RepID=A0A0G0Z8F0_UNCC2|nr:MAG: hypothetical protein UT47_C0002G0213 [candidate division CPR2 bacterium GW2011_GWC2_39_35]KKR29071.1 MAG: hypothetical protein UT60_C0007G0016 [candidate division CPR2 bacterium GW2011_GWD2_39_7]KKS09313.1 MAG: hypothetical protein UU65_C0002G0091 [candidate division CPR2 bacterium GW2011_GWC1_41_48]OGB70559.1 MAG: hypothetical protein A2Y26_04430 [candidate division CPR2 bacterium GWD2_39_7]